MKNLLLEDHLGNVRATLSDYRRLASQAIVNSATDYYPFGMVARTYASSQQYRYGFNGKEQDSDLDGGTTYDYGFRIYNPNIARFLSVDPLMKDYPWYTPYQFAGNMPINCIDIDGLEPESMIDKNGKLTEPMVSVLNAAFLWEKASLTNATWRPYTYDANTRAWASITDIPAGSAASTGMGTTVVHDADASRSDVEWFSLIAHEQSHEHDIYHDGATFFVVEYLAEGAAKKYRDISTEETAYKYGSSGNTGLSQELLNYNSGEFMKILNDPLKTVTQKSMEAESLGARFRRDVVLQKEINNYSSLLSSAEAKLTSIEKNGVGPGVDNAKKIWTQRINEYKAKINNAKNEQVKITETYGK